MRDMRKKTYVYVGPIYAFGVIYKELFNCTTHAISKPQAKSNILYRAKKQFGFSIDSKLEIKFENIKEV